jgi:putative aldouronate transport system permease protein
MKNTQYITRHIADVFIYIFLASIALLSFFPFFQIVVNSFTTQKEMLERSFILIPHTFSLEAYKFIFSGNSILRSLGVSTFITVVGTCINLLFTTTMAYALARKELRARRTILFIVVFTMLFEGGMIPTYLVVKELHMLNTYWAVMIPNAISAFNLILMRNFFLGLPEELFESAKMDGYNDLTIYYRIALPLSKAAIATFALFYAVMHWNNFMMPFLYLSDSHMWPVQIWLRQVVMLATADFSDVGFATTVPSQSIRMAVIVVATTPILLVYPFIQKHFVKGAMLGSVKG